MFRPIHVAVITKNLNMVKRCCFIIDVLQYSVDLRNNSDLVSKENFVVY